MSNGEGGNEQAGARKEALEERPLRALRELPLDEEQARSVSRRLLASSLLLRRPHRLASNSPFFDFRRKVEEVVAWFEAEGLGLEVYLHACLRQPQLFYLWPAAVIARIDQVIGMRRDRLLCFFGDEGVPPAPLKPLFASLVKNPSVLCCSEENLALRRAYALAAGERPPLRSVPDAAAALGAVGWSPD